MKEAKRLAEERGLKVVFFAGGNLLIGTDVRARGFISGNKVFVRVDHPKYTADQIMRHEAGHDMIAKGEVDPDEVRERIREKYTEEELDKIAAEYVNAYKGTGLTPEEIWEEVICDSLGDMNIFAGDDLIGEYMGDFLADLKGEAQRSTKPARAPPGGVVKTSRETDNFVEDKYFRYQIAKWNSLNQTGFIKVGKIGPDSPIHRVGMPLGVLRFDVSKLKKNMADHADYLTIELLNAIPEIISKPVAISEYAAENTISVFGDVFVGGSPMMVGITISKDRAGNDITKIRTYNARRDAGSLITDSSILYLDSDKKRTRKWFQACGINVPLGGSKFGFIRSISQSSPKVKTKTQKTSRELDMDSDGNTLSVEQSDYFADSQVRDDNGNLKVVYHGTGAQFNEFSYKFMSMHGSMERQGFYFTDNKNMAEGYQKEGGKLFEGYLLIKKPLSDSKLTLTKAEVTKLLKEIDPTGDDIVLNYDPNGGIGYPSKAWYDRSLRATVESLMSYNETDSELLAEIANAGGGAETVVKGVRKLLGYDGYIVSDKYDNTTVYVAFESNQFKDKANKTPTENPDTRYSRELDYIDYIDSGEVSDEALTPRRILSDVLAETVTTPKERKAITEYHANLANMEKLEATLREQRAMLAFCLRSCYNIPKSPPPKEHTYDTL